MNAARSTIAAVPSTDLALPAWLVRTFAIDARALAVLRIGLGLILLWDLAVRSLDLTAHYTDDGVLPRSARMAMDWDFCEPWWMSLHMLSGSVAWQATLFAVAAIAAGMLVVGYRTKFALLLSWLLLLSLHGRFPLLTQGGDMLLRCMLFWSLFLPLSRAEGRGQRAEGYVASMGTVAFMVQLAVMYVFTALLKTSPSWRSEFSAAYYALSIDHFTSEAGYLFLAHPRLLQGLTASSMLLEAVGPLLLLLPIWHTAVRMFVPLAFIGFHLGLAVTMDLGTFPWICILFWIVLLPPAVWDRLSFPRPKSTLSVSLIGSAATNAIAASLLAYVVLLNCNRLTNPLATVGRPPLSYLGKATGLEQYWNMFSPGPYQFGGWIRLEGETAAGYLVNLYRPGEPLPDVKPLNVSATYPTQYWRRCLVTMYEFQEQPHLEGGLRYFARQWNCSHSEEERVVRARFVHMRESVPEPFAEVSAPRTVERHVLCELQF